MLAGDMRHIAQEVKENEYLEILDLIKEQALKGELCLTTRLSSQVIIFRLTDLGYELTQVAQERMNTDIYRIEW